MNGRRSNIEIIADILRMGQGSKTQIIYRVGMSYAQIQKYLVYLLERGFLTHDQCKYPSGIYRISPEGKLLLQSIENIEQLLAFNDWGGSEENISQSLLAPRKNGKKAYQAHEIYEMVRA